MKMTGMLGVGLSALGLTVAPVAQAATLPTTANITVDSGSRLGQSATAGIHRAASRSEGSSDLLGLPFIAIFLGTAAVVTVAVVVAVTNNTSSPGS